MLSEVERLDGHPADLVKAHAAADEEAQNDDGACRSADDRTGGLCGPNCPEMLFVALEQRKIQHLIWSASTSHPERKCWSDAM